MVDPAPQIIADLKPVPQPSVMARLRNYFLTGLIVAGPVAVTAWIIWTLIKWLDGLVAPLIPPALRPESYTPVAIPGTGLVIVLVGLTLLGFFTANFVGRTMLGWGESLLGRMPIVRPIYKMMKQIFETLFSKSGSSFRKVALVEFPAPGMWSLVFLSQSPSSDIADKLPAKEHISAFMPCTPNPTTGFFFYVPVADLIEIDITVEQAMTLLISAGMVQPQQNPQGEGQEKLAALAATAQASRKRKAPAKEAAK